MTGRILIIGPSSTLAFELIYEITAHVACSEYIEPLKPANPGKGHERNYQRPFYHGIKRKR